MPIGNKRGKQFFFRIAHAHNENEQKPAIVNKPPSNITRICCSFSRLFPSFFAFTPLVCKQVGKSATIRVYCNGYWNGSNTALRRFTVKISSRSLVSERWPQLPLSAFIEFPFCAAPASLSLLPSYVGPRFHFVSSALSVLFHCSAMQKKRKQKPRIQLNFSWSVCISLHQFAYL